jgi:hypothetical protein
MRRNGGGNLVLDLGFKIMIIVIPYVVVGHLA